MCGIAGLFIKDPALEPRLGALLAPMVAALSDRGPDSAGFAIYGHGNADTVKLTLRLPPPPRGRGAANSDGGARETAGGDGRAATSFRVHATRALADGLTAALGHEVTHRLRGTHALLSVPVALEAEARDWLAANHPEVAIVGAGERMELYKEVGRPEQVAELFDLAAVHGSHAVCHTRMATESAVTTAGAHPFSTGTDQCLVHNGSLSNHNAVRRRLVREGLAFATDNDSEVAAGYLTWRMREGASLAEALEASLADLDGFYTFVVGTRDGFAVLRDPIACKPAVMAETARYVAFGSEYRALATLPGIDAAHVWEPEPAKVYAWERG